MPPLRAPARPSLPHPVRALLAASAALAALALPGSLTAQASGGIQGRVVTEGTGPVAGAAVTARRDGDTATVARAASGADGRFQLRGLAPGRYRVSATHLGRTASAAAPVTVGSGMAEAGDLRLGTVVLEGLQVSAERPPVVHAEDRNVYSVRDMPTAGGVAADVMRTLPELEVDMDGTIRMVGNRPVTIHINGRPSPLKGEALTEFIRNLPADRIDRIEVIPNPSVRFEGGDAAIVNVVLRKDVELGLGGSLSLNTATRGGHGVSGQVAYQRGRVTLFGGGSTRTFGYDNRSREERQNLLSTPVTILDEDRVSEGHSSHASADLTVELSLGEKETLWASSTGYLGSWGSEGTSHNRLLGADRSPLRVYDRATESDADFLSSDFAAGFRRIIEPQKHELSLEVRRNGNRNESLGRFEETPLEWAEGVEPGFELRRTAGDSYEGALTAKVDYQRPLGTGRRLELGARTSRTEQTNDQSIRIFDAPGAPVPAESTENPFGYQETQHSVYANLSQKLGRFSLQGGLRAEGTSMELEPRGRGGVQQPFGRDYFSVFPSANVSATVKEGVDVRLSYSGRVRRPWIWDLNPYVQQTDARNLRFGNPELEPAETRSVNADLSWRARLVTLRLAPYYRRTDDEIEYIRTVDAAGVSTVVPRNLATVENYGATLNASLRANRWGTLTATVGASRDERDGGAAGAAYSRSGDNRFFSANANLQPGRGFSLQASLRASTPRETAQGSYSSTAHTSVGMRKELFGRKASFDLRVTDPFNTFRTTWTSSDPSFSGTSRSRSSWGNRSAAASFTYRFGKPPERKSRPADQGAPSTGGAPTP